MKKFYDTCSIMEDNSDLSDVIISSITIQELENIKTGNKDKETKSKARAAVRAIKSQNPKVIIYNPLWEEEISNRSLEITNDNKIIISAVKSGCDYFYTEDYLCGLIARDIFNLNIASAKERSEIYKGYKLIEGNSNDITNFYNNINFDDWVINEYLIIHNIEDDTWSEQRFDGSKFINLRLPNSKYIKGKNSEQRCALDALNNENIDIVAVLGGYGSGKTYLCMQMAKYNIDEKGRASKIVGIRNPESESKEVGFLQGSFEDKTSLFFAPLEDSLHGGKYELDDMKRYGKLSVEIPYYLKGRTFTNSILVCDEAEDFSESEIKLIGTRLGENSKVYWCGDYKQSVMNKSTSNPLAKMCSKLKGNPKFACVCLGEDVRSSVSKIYSEIFDD